MTLARQYRPSVRLDWEELDGLLRMLDDRIAEMGENGEYITCYYVGARTAASIFRFCEFVDVPADFMRLFDRKIRDIEGDE